MMGAQIRLTAAATAMAGATAAVLLLSGCSGTPVEAAAQPSTPPPAASDATATAVRANQGGIGFAPNSLTRVGFSRSCTGAVEAATSYVTGPTTYPGDADGARALATFVAPSDSAGAKAYRANVERAGRPDVEMVDSVATGGYRVATCTPGQFAAVEVFHWHSVDEGGKKSGRYVVSSVTLEWVHAANDWKLTSWQQGVSGPAAARTGKSPWPMRLSPAERTKLLAAGGPGWHAYTGG